MDANGAAPTVEEILERLQDADTLPSEIRAEQRKTVEYGGGERTTRLEIRERLPVKFRVEGLSTAVVEEFDFDLEVVGNPMSELKDGADVLIQNRDGLVAYDSERNRYRRYEFEPPEENAGHTTRTTLIGPSPAETFDVTYDGADTVAGRETHVLSFRPSTSADSPSRQPLDRAQSRQGFNYIRLWVDREYWFPLAREAELRIQDAPLFGTDAPEDLRDGTLFQTEAFVEVEFDAGIEDSAFSFDPPDDAECVEHHQIRQSDARD